MKSISVHQCYQWLINFFLVCVALLGVHPPARAADRPNVLILFTDDQGTLDVNCYGAADLQTPNLDKLAASGVRFTQAYAHTVCCPSRAALLTGRHPQRSGVGNWLQNDRHDENSGLSNMDAQAVTLAEVLKAEGYDTALFGKWHLGAKPGHGPLDQGFDTYWGHLGGFIDNYRHYFLHGQGFHDLYDGETEIFRRGEYYPDLLVEQATAYLKDERDKPFFMMVSFNLPHYPEQPIGKYKRAYPDLPMPRQSYARVISTVDEHIGRILDTLEERGLRDDTLVIYMSDNGHSEENNKGIAVDNHSSGYPKGHYYLAHGGGGYTGKWIGRKATFLEGGIRVPAIISYPKVLPRGEVRDQMVSIMDWFPTVLELAGIPKPEASLDGRSMWPILRNKAAPSSHSALYFGWKDDWAVRQGNWKLVSAFDRREGLTKVSLYNLADEHPEVIDHAAKHPEIVDRLTALNQAWGNDTGFYR